MADDTKPSDHLRNLADQIERDPELDDDDQLRIHNAAAGAAQRIQYERAWRAFAHVHDVRHEVKWHPADPKQGEPEGEKIIESNDMICHDCRRELIGDSDGTLICPKLHNQRPSELVPKRKLGAVECGQPDV